MEVVTGALTSVITKHADLVSEEYSLQKGLKEQIVFLHDELNSMQGALQKISKIPADQRDIQDKIWASELRELSYDIEDSVDTFKVRGKGNELGELHGIKKFISRGIGLLREAKIRHGIATEIKDIKKRVEEVSRRRHRYKIDNDAAEPTTMDPRFFAQYKNVREPIGIDEAREEVIKILMKSNEASKLQNKTVSIVGFGGLGKTTLANAVYEEIKKQFDCSAFVSVSQTPDMEKLLKNMLNQFGKRSDASIDIIVKELSEFLEKKRYFIVLDDIWDVSIWKNINSALPDNSFGNIIITTTRSVNVAEEAGGAYKLKPLSLNNSRKLLYCRVFGNERNEDISKCPYKELAEVSDKILKKCAGVPLAIVTMASLLYRKGRDKQKWYEVYNSVGTGLENNLDVNNMRKILSFSYYDMPSHLRTCMLYLSMFPEDRSIGKSRLIQLWIAEGFIQGAKPGESLFELGESYFNELMNRSMIQPEYDAYLSSRLCCRVHDMVLDLLCSLSSEENFVTTLNDVVGLSMSKKVRRLSLQKTTSTDHAARQVATMSMKQVRSVVVFVYAFELLPALPRFGVLRVLDLEECDIPEDYCLKYLGNLVHLRYIGLGKISNKQLPEEIGNLRFLQTLLVDSNLSVLPSSIVQLKHLISIRVYTPKVPRGIGNLTSLEQLFAIYTDSIEIIEEMGNLTELRVLGIVYTDALLDKSFFECLCKLKKIKSLIIYQMDVPDDELILNDWVAPEHIRILELGDGGFSRLPVWMNPSSLQHLSALETYVGEFQLDDFELLGKMPALRSLSLRLGHVWAGLPRRFTTAAGLFACLVHLKVLGYVQPLEFQRGAMPRLETLGFTFLWWEMVEIVRNSGGFDFDLTNLSSLKHVTGYLRGRGIGEDERNDAGVVLRHAVKTHPNQPTVWIDWIEQGHPRITEWNTDL